MRLLGFQITRTPDEEKELEALKSITPTQNDGSLVVDQGVNDGLYGDALGYSMSFDADTDTMPEHQLITKYRELALVPEVEYAIDDIINEMCSTTDNDLIDIDLDELEYSQVLKEKIQEEFEYIVNLLDFNNQGFRILKRWYVDGRLPYHIVLDQNTYKEVGIGKLTYIDPRLLKKVRVVKRDKDIRTGADLYMDKDEYFIYSDTGFGANLNGNISAQSETGTKLSKESVVYCTSGVLNPSNTTVLSHLHKAIRPFNQLRSLEDAAIIYRLSRAPERRVFYIDVGNLPPAKAEQVLKRQMNQYKSKIVYDTASGTVRSDPRHMTMIEDYWLPRRSDGKATEITTLPGGQNLGEMTEVEYFLNKLYKALNVPASRLDPQQGFNFGRVTEISRDELKFMKFINRLRKDFSHLFLDLLRTQLALKNILNPNEFDNIKNDISFEYRSDNMFEEAKNNEILTGRLELLDKITPYKGDYYSIDWIRRNVLRLSQEDIDQMDETMDEEEASGEYEEENPEAGGAGGAGAGQPASGQVATILQLPVQTQPATKTVSSAEKKLNHGQAVHTKPS